MANHFCCSCMFFHRGNGVHHSHCDNSESPYRYYTPLKYNGRILACRHRQKRKRKGHDTTRKYIYLGTKMTDERYKNKPCEAIISSDNKCICGKNGTMLVKFNDQAVNIIRRRLRKQC